MTRSHSMLRRMRWPHLVAAALPLGLGCGGGGSDHHDAGAGAVDMQVPTFDSGPTNGCPPGRTEPENEVFDVDVPDGGSLSDAGCVDICQHKIGDLGPYECTSQPLDFDGGSELAVSCNYVLPVTCIGGRRPAGFEGAVQLAHNEIGRWLAHSAALEAASVPAFHILRAELHAHGAPAALIAACGRAAEDEARHVRLMERLARRYGALSAPVAVAARPVRMLAEIAVENAVEGGVRERFAAWQALLQAQTARDPEVRRAFAIIAPEEQEHAALSDEVHAWAGARLTTTERRRVAEAQALAQWQLAASLDEPPAALRTQLGLPDATRAQDLAARLPLAVHPAS
jgi:hypothetical protein